jgi:hypothetical protein
VAVLADWATGVGCGGDTTPIPPRGSALGDFCDALDGDAFAGFLSDAAFAVAPLATLILGLVALGRRSAGLLVAAAALGIALAVTPPVVRDNLSGECPASAPNAYAGQCVP